MASYLTTADFKGVYQMVNILKISNDHIFNSLVKKRVRGGVVMEFDSF